LRLFTTKVDNIFKNTQKHNTLTNMGLRLCFVAKALIQENNRIQVSQLLLTLASWASCFKTVCWSVHSAGCSSCNLYPWNDCEHVQYEI